MVPEGFKCSDHVLSILIPGRFLTSWLYVGLRELISLPVGYSMVETIGEVFGMNSTPEIRFIAPEEKNFMEPVTPIAFTEKEAIDCISH